MSRKLVLVSVVVLCLAVTVVALAASGRITVYVNGAEIHGDALLQNGRTYLPVRAVAEALGCSVVWDAQTRSVHIAERDPTQPAGAASVAPVTRSSVSGHVSAAPAPTPAPQPAVTTKASSSDATVYVTNSGKKYHRGSCRYLSKSKIPISKTDAGNQGYGACSVCKP